MQAPPKPIAASVSLKLPASVAALEAIGGSRVAAGLGDGQIAIWNGSAAASAQLFKPHTTRILAVGASADGRDLLSLSADGVLARTALATPDAPATQKIDTGAARIVAAAFSSDGSTLVTGGMLGELRVFDTASGALKHRLHRHRTEIQCLAIRPGGSTIASASAEADLRIWDGASGRELQAIVGDLSLFAVTFSPRDGTLASGGVDRRLTLREPSAFKTVGEFALKAPLLVAALAWSPDGALLALGDIDDATLSKGGLRVLNATDRAVVATLEIPGPASNLVFADARLLIGSGGPFLASWAIP
jgi:WD40 repeat protein